MIASVLIQFLQHTSFLYPVPYSLFGKSGTPPCCQNKKAPVKGRGQPECFHNGIILIVTIHALTGGATGWKPTFSISGVKFQSTPLREGRQGIANGVCPLDAFQSTPLREGRRSRPTLWIAVKSFYPRPYERGDVEGIQDQQELPVSIHAPTRGATCK